MDGLQINGRSSISARSRTTPKTLGVNFSQRAKKKKDTSSKSSLHNSKDSQASTTDLNHPSDAEKIGNPLLSMDDVLQRLSRSIPPSETHSYNDDEPVRDRYTEVTMQPDFSNKDMAGGGMFAKRLDSAAIRIQHQWRTYRQNKKLKPPEDNSFLDNIAGIQMSKEVKQMLQLERDKLLKEKNKESLIESKKKSAADEKRHQARLSAIEDLNRKREEKRKLQQQLLEEELKLTSEQISKKKKKLREITKPRPVSAKNEKTVLREKPRPQKSAKPPNVSVETLVSARQSTVNSSYNNLIDEIFSSTRQTNLQSELDSDNDTPRAAWGNNVLSNDSTPRNDKVPEHYGDAVILSPKARDDNASVTEKRRAYSSLMETLKLLEAETEEVLSETKSSSIIIPPTPKLTQGEVYRLDSFGARDLHTSGMMASGKIKNLLSFLDNVNTTSPPSEDIQSTGYASSIAAVSGRERMRNASAAVEEITENVKLTQEQLDRKAHQLEILKCELSSTSSKTAELQAKVYATRLECDEKGKGVLMLQRALDEQRDLTLRLTHEQEKDAQQRIANQKTEYETTIKRHLGFIDQLIADKKQLSEKVEALVSQLKTIEKTLGDKVKHLEDSKKFEMNKQKEALDAAEKIRRERWISEKSNQIKEMTVKGLEPEIQKLIGKNKNEVKRLKALHEAELLEADERASKRFVAQVEELREQFAREKETACARERDYAQKRYEKQIEQEEVAYQQQRRRLYTEVQEEKERVADSLTKQRALIEEDKISLEDDNKTKIAKAQAQHTIEMEQLRNEHSNAFRDFKLRAQVEKEQWLEHQKQKQVTELLSKERDIRGVLKAERDREIEMVITKLEEENAVQREDNDAGMECRMRRLRDKYEGQIADVEHINNTTQAKINAMKERVTDLEADNIRLRGGIKNIERENEEIEKVSSRLKAERDKVETVIREEFSERLVVLEEECKSAKADLVEAKTRHKLETKRFNTVHETEMEEVQVRITAAFSKRDEVIKELSDKAVSATSRADHLESLLIKQREELLRPRK